MGRKGDAAFDRAHPQGADYVIVPAMGDGDVPEVIAWRREQVDRGVATTTGITVSVPATLALVEAIGGREKAQAIAAELGVRNEAGDVAALEWRDPLGLRGCGFFTVRDGRIVFQRGYCDRLSFLRLHGLPVDTRTARRPTGWGRCQSAVEGRNAIAACQRCRFGCVSSGRIFTIRAKSTATAAVMSAMLKPSPATNSRSLRRASRATKN